VLLLIANNFFLTTGHTEVLRTLLSLDGKTLLGIKDMNGATPLDLAIEKSQVRTTSALKKELTTMTDKYNLTDRKKSLVGFFTPYVFYLCFIIGCTAGFPFLTIGLLAAVSFLLRRQKDRLYPSGIQTNTVILGIFYASFQFTLGALLTWCYDGTRTTIIIIIIHRSQLG